MNTKIFKKENSRLANVNFSAGHQQVAMIGVIAIAAVALLFASVAIVGNQQASALCPSTAKSTLPHLFYPAKWDSKQQERCHG